MTERRVAVITGAANGIGWSTALRLARTGIRFVLIDVDEQCLADRGAALRREGAEVAVHAASVSDLTAMETIVRQTVDEFSRIDILVNVAGGSGPTPLFEIETIPLETWDQVFDANLRSVFVLCRAIVPHMRRQQFGRIVNVSSTLAYGRYGPVGGSGARLAYAAAKAGLLGFSRQLAKDTGSDAITVNAVLPALTLGEKGSRMRMRYDALPQEVQLKLVETIPARRPGTAAEVAALICFLVSEDASFVSGRCIPVDGAML